MFIYLFAYTFLIIVQNFLNYCFFSLPLVIFFLSPACFSFDFTQFLLCFSVSWLLPLFHPVIVFKFA